MYDRDAWIKNLKVNEIVAYNVKNYIDNQEYIVSKIKRITPTGRIVLENGTKFDNNGYYYIDKFHSIHIVPYTCKVKESIEKLKILNKINKTKFEKLDLDQLKGIEVIIDLPRKDEVKV